MESNHLPPNFAGKQGSVRRALQDAPLPSALAKELAIRIRTEIFAQMEEAQQAADFGRGEAAAVTGRHTDFHARQRICHDSSIKSLCMAPRGVHVQPQFDFIVKSQCMYMTLA